MGTIADKLTYLNGTKTAIKEAIEAKGVTVSDTDTFRSYADKIGEINGAIIPTFAGVPSTAFCPTISEDGTATAINILFPNSILDLSNVVSVGPKAFASLMNMASARGISYVYKIDLSNLQSVSNESFYYTFHGYGAQVYHTEVDLSSLEEINAPGAFNHAFTNAEIASVNLTSLKTITGNYAASGCFNGNYIEEFNLSSLEEINGNYACDYFGAYGRYMRVINLSGLKTVTGSNACNYCFSRSGTSNRADGTKGIETLNLNSLETVNGPSAMANFLSFSNTAASFEELIFPKLTTITGSAAFQGFADTADIKIKRFKFPMLTTIANNAFGSYATTTVFSKNVEEIHFREDMEETISAMPGYANKWGAVNATIYFDLPATQPDETEEA